VSPFTKEALEAQARHWEEEAHRQRRFRILQGIIGLVALGALISFTIWYTGYVRHKADQRWCAFMVPLDKRYQQLPPEADPEAKEFAERLNYLVVNDLKC
jgi:ABC-type transport system involved in cytochrome bd biosynthesis fused ATPase/permease subunit